MLLWTAGTSHSTSGCSTIILQPDGTQVFCAQLRGHRGRLQCVGQPLRHRVCFDFKTDNYCKDCVTISKEVVVQCSCL